MAPETMDKSVLEGKVASELHTIAAGLGIEGHQRLKKADLIDRILAAGTDGDGAGTTGPSTAAGTVESPAERTEASDNGEVATAPPQTEREERDARGPGERPEGRPPEGARRRLSRE
ncbi:MAG: Rho termination factor N-terminal domain-containing protein, partial [Actinomycetota bacterium]